MRPLRYESAGVSYRVLHYGRFIGTVRRLQGSRWAAQLPDGSEFPTMFTARRAAGERLRLAAEAQNGRAA